jgi:hypothetical protein
MSIEKIIAAGIAKISRLKYSLYFSTTLLFALSRFILHQFLFSADPLCCLLQALCFFYGF